MKVYIHLLIAWNAIWLGNHRRRIPTSFFVADVTDDDEQNIHKNEYDLKNYFPKQQTESSPKPLILSRPSSNCFLLSLENIQLLCQSDRCTVLGPDDSAVRRDEIQ